MSASESIIKFQDKTRDIDQLFSLLPEKATIVTAMAAAEPAEFFNHIHSKVQNKSKWRVFCANPSRPFPCFSNAELAGQIEFIPMFLTSAVRKLQGNNLIHYIPQHLSQWSDNLIKSEHVNVFWGTCSPPDERGFVSLGLSNCYESEIIRNADITILETNPNVPVTFGGTCIHISEIDYFLKADYQIPTIEPARADECDTKIAEIVCDLISDGSTLQLGIGGIPNAVAELLESKKDLGIHTEMINDAMMNLYKKGVVTGTQKTLWPRKIVGAFALGSKDLYTFLNNNPGVVFEPAKVVNDPYRIGQNYKMISLNTAVEIDITGQVCSESLGHVELSGVGGAADTHIGAQRSPEGRGIIAMRSMTPKGDSKINFELLPGAKVSISRNDVDTIVTEYGVAVLKGHSVAARARQLIGIAHPSQREKLEFNAKKFKYI